jgi:hypothetical protein
MAWEEIALRRVLRAALRRVMDEPGATVMGSAVFLPTDVDPAERAGQPYCVFDGRAVG